MNSSESSSVTDGLSECDVASDHSSTVSTSTLNASSAENRSITNTSDSYEAVENTDIIKLNDKEPEAVHQTLLPDDDSAEILSESDSRAVETQKTGASSKPNAPTSHSIQPNEYIYHIKRIKFRGKSKPIITQNENGPCPLIAITNVLLLQEFISLPESNEVVTGERLIAKLSDLLLSKSVQGLDTGQLLNYETTVSDALNLFPSLQTGLDVNVRFTGVTAFEFTSVLSVFDLFGITLYHGWLVDPGELELASVIGDRTYNQLVEQVIRLKASLNPEDVRKGLLADTFLEQTASQLTYHGLYELTDALTEGQLAVLFRNNHFSTIIKHQGRIYVLVTDLGLLNEPNIVWEALDDVDGNTQFVDATFHLYSPVESTNTGEYNLPRTPTLRPVASDRGATKSSSGSTAASSVKSALWRTFVGTGGSKEDSKSSNTGSAKGVVGGATSEFPVDELARACSEHLRIGSKLDHVRDSDLSLAARLQLEEIESSSTSSKSDSRIIVVRQEEVSKRALKSEAHCPLSADDLTQICSEDILEQAKLELGTGTDLDLAMQLQFEEVQRSQQTRLPAEADRNVLSNPPPIHAPQRPTTTVNSVAPTVSSPRQARSYTANPRGNPSVPVVTQRPNNEDKSSCVTM